MVHKIIAVLIYLYALNTLVYAQSCGFRGSGDGGYPNYNQHYDHCPSRGTSSRCCEHVTYSKNKPFCDELFRDDDMGWTRFFSGYYGSGAKVDRLDWNKMCGGVTGGLQVNYYRTATSENRVQYSKDTLKEGFEQYTNRLRFTDSVIAQEGISFCIVGSHYRKSPFALWEPLKPFIPIAEKGFDIGNHIDPYDANKMNTFDRPRPDELRIPRQAKPGHPWKDRNLIPDHRFENVWLGHGYITKEKESKYHWVPLHEGFEKRPAHPEWQPHKDCKNPYRVTTTLIEADGLTLHNYLHIKVYAEPVSQPSGKNCPTGKIKFLMLEVRDQDGLPVGLFTDDIPCEKDKKTAETYLSCPAGATCKSHQGTKKNIVPCMFSHSKSVVHPTIFMLAAGDLVGGGGGGSGPGGPPSQSTDDVCRSNQKPKNSRNPPNVQYKENSDQYVTEVHATWRYAQLDEGWASELHFATMIIEDETPIQYYTSRLTYWDGIAKEHYCAQQGWWIPWNPQGGGGVCGWGYYCCWGVKWEPDNEYKPGRFQLGLINSCWNETYNTNRPYGYSARYTMIKPTFNTRGGWDFFRKQYISPLDVDCHVDIPYGPEFYYELEDENNPDKLGRLPLRKTLSDLLRENYTLQHSKYKPPSSQGYDQRDRLSGPYPNTYELSDWHVVGMSNNIDGGEKFHAYYSKKPEWAALKMFDSAHQDPVVLKTEFSDKPFREYFGSRYIIPSTPSINQDVTKLQTSQALHDQEYTMEEMTSNSNSRCPCPFVPTTPPPELATKPPVEIEGRRTHVVNMLLAWVILVPIAFFVSRFYKETYARVFFLQEFWWLAMHILCLVTALLFTFGGIYALKAKRSLGEPYEIVWTDATLMHIYLGYGVIGVFIFHLLVGSFRFNDVQLRIIQIGLHWLFGWLEYLFAMGCIMAAAAIPSGIMNCLTFGIYCCFIVFQVVFTLGMEYHLRKVDEILDLNPPRSYLPPPVMRLFHTDAPHARFRIIMLAVYAIACFLFYAALHLSTSMEGGEQSCFQPTADAQAQEVTE